MLKRTAAPGKNEPERALLPTLSCAPEWKVEANRREKALALGTSQRAAWRSGLASIPPPLTPLLHSPPWAGRAQQPDDRREVTATQHTGVRSLSPRTHVGPPEHRRGRLQVSLPLRSPVPWSPSASSSLTLLSTRALLDAPGKAEQGPSHSPQERAPPEKLVSSALSPPPRALL